MRLAALGLVLLTWCFTGCSTLPQRTTLFGGAGSDFDLRLAAARDREQQGDYVRAKQQYQELLAENAQHPVVQHRLGVVAVKQNALAEGLGFLERAQSLAPNNAEVLTDLGYALYLQGRIDEAATTLRNATAADPANKRAANNLGLVLGKQGRMQEAHGVFRQISSEAESLASLGYIHAQLGNLDEAETHFSRALDEDGDLKAAAEALLQIAEQRKSKPSSSLSAKPESLTKAKSRPKAGSSREADIEDALASRREMKTKKPPRLSREELASQVQALQDLIGQSEADSDVASAAPEVRVEKRELQAAHAFFAAPVTDESRMMDKDARRAAAVRLTGAESPE